MKQRVRIKGGREPNQKMAIYFLFFTRVIRIILEGRTRLPLESLNSIFLDKTPLGCKFVLYFLDLEHIVFVFELL
jgi:hypothetical protein